MNFSSDASTNSEGLLEVEGRNPHRGFRVGLWADRDGRIRRIRAPRLEGFARSRWRKRHRLTRRRSVRGCLELDLPMRGRREDWRQPQERAARQLLEWLKTYQTVAFPVLGDPGVYATSSYLYRLVKDAHPCEIVPGVPSMCAAAARLGVPLCEQGETLTVLDRFEDGQALPEGNAVVMKSARHMAALRSAAEGRKAYVVRNLGMEDEWLGSLNDAPSMDGFYFTTTIVRP